jgi:hypothetical protein
MDTSKWVHATVHHGIAEQLLEIHQACRQHMSLRKALKAAGYHCLASSMAYYALNARLQHQIVHNGMG